MIVRLALLAILAATTLVTTAVAQHPQRPKYFYRDGGWTGEVQATSWGDLDTAKAWAIGRHSRVTALKACSGRTGRENVACVRQLLGEPETRIYADCTTATTWRDGDANRVSLSDEAKAGKLKPLDDDRAWSMPLTHRAKWAISSWLVFLCPSSAIGWGFDAGPG